jgi:ribose 5-phosphate isomerase RpiB
MAPFGVFVCSTCAGIHREFSNKVKGISMSNFTEQETKFLAENGNKVSVNPD